MAFPTFQELKADYQSWRGGYKRVSPYGTRGRVYASTFSDRKPTGIMSAFIRLRPNITVRVWNNTDKQYYTPEQQNIRIKEQIREGLVNPGSVRIEDIDVGDK